RRLTEVLKQEPYSPLPVERQILIIYAGNRGFLDEIPLDELKKYEKELYKHFESKYDHLLQTLADKKQIDMELDEEINKALKEFNQAFMEELQVADNN
ncbi:MAG: F0F1 ATP synthase subunit alpha, partial [Candidatus Saccharicenans sp.]|nr:F0F1 ATP synthase subunit alpha [Candidatus Saccharicenans sp.]